MLIGIAQYCEPERLFNSARLWPSLTLMLIGIAQYCEPERLFNSARLWPVA